MGKGLKKPKIYTVSEINSSIKKTLESSFASVWVEGEVSNYYFHNRRHMYFDLKDEYSKIKVAMFYQNNKELMFEISDGLHILVNGYVSLYEKKGEYQIIATDIKPVGKGSLILVFEQLKEKLEKKGYFKKEVKKALPVLPRKIGLATSTGGAVIRDIISVLNRRSDNYNLVVRNVNVGGPTSGDEVCQAIDDLVSYGVDVIILARGGGSLEDLWGFNTEILADKIYSCTVPIISAVGHETDFTISDFAADIRAATPSVGAELVTLNKIQAVEDICSYNLKLKKLASSRIRFYRRELDYLIHRKVFEQPQSIISQYWQTVDDLSMKIRNNGANILRSKKEKLLNTVNLLKKGDLLRRVGNRRLKLDSISSELLHYIKKILDSKKNMAEILVRGLQASSPAAILGRGFGIVYKEKEDILIRSIDDVSRGESIRVLIKDGILMSRVIDKLSKNWGKENE
ncbi:MAG: exodeoxyribonuclease VII large subunit [Actinomycetota bacterium]